MYSVLSKLWEVTQCHNQFRKTRKCTQKKEKDQSKDCGLKFNNTCM